MLNSGDPVDISVWNPTGLSSNCATSFHSVNRSTADGVISRYWPPASADASATAASSRVNDCEVFL